MQSPPFIQSNQENHSKTSYLGLAVRVGGGVRVARETVYGIRAFSYRFIVRFSSRPRQHTRGGSGTRAHTPSEQKGSIVPVVREPVTGCQACQAFRCKEWLMLLDNLGNSLYGFEVGQNSWNE